ncbi:hypothetical protein PVT01_030028600 [Plasmodium vivax]|uniref:VIR protein n=1 Tax=Plasmodium vivax TaxID=5855 RepID=A0A1G4GSA2_PLAVI|nr:hypothetical protein PVT01_030028600 [Plasmodium vivax]
MDFSQDNLQILALCNNNETYQTNPTENDITVCKNLLKNLKTLSNNSYNNKDNFFTGCKNLNNWLYFIEKELDISSDIINKVFQAYKKIKHVNYHLYDCPYFEFDKGFNEKEKLIDLRIFNDNAVTIQSLLKDIDKSKDCNLKKYVYECVDIYKEMNIAYTFPQDCSMSQHKNACDIMKEFNRLYLSYIYKNDGILHEFPELSTKTITKVIDGCSSQDNTGETTFGDSPKTGTSITQGVPSVLSAMFTPVRRFLSFKNKKSATSFSNLGEEVENELIIQQFEDTRINSVPPKYNVAYGQI